jgi:hypothetical protein
MLEMYQSKTKQALLLGKFSKESFTFDQFLHSFPYFNGLSQILAKKRIWYGRQF